MDPRRLSELRSLAYHREVARRLANDPSLLHRARRRAAEWSLTWSEASAPYARSWLSLLDGPRERLLEVLVTDSEEARDMRQTSPFAGSLSPRERWEIWRSIA